jgi:hypothetical protein
MGFINAILPLQDVVQVAPKYELFCEQLHGSELCDTAFTMVVWPHNALTSPLSSTTLTTDRTAGSALTYKL